MDGAYFFQSEFFFLAVPICMETLKKAYVNVQENGII